MVFKLGIKFVTPTGFSEKTYFYYMTEDALKTNASVAKPMCLELAKGRMMTEDGCNYHGSDVIVVRISASEPIENYRYIKYFYDVKFENRTTNLLNRLEKEFISQWFDEHEGGKATTVTLPNNCTVTIPNLSTDNDHKWEVAIIPPPSGIVGTTSGGVLGTIPGQTFYTSNSAGISVQDYKDYLDQIIAKTCTKTKNEKESSIMNKMFSNIYFGKAKGLGMSLYGLCEYQGDKAFAVNEANEVIDASCMVMMKDCCYLMPTPINQIKEGDWVHYHGAYYKIITIDTETPAVFNAICIGTQKLEAIVPAKSPFGFDFMEKVLNPFEGFKWDMTAGGDNNAQMNAMLPLMMMSDKGDKKDMMMMMMLMQGQNGMSGMNPMMMMALMSDDDHGFCKDVGF